MKYKVRVERYGETRIIGKIPWMNGAGPEMAKQIPGFAPVYDRSGRRDVFVGWSFPLDLLACRNLRLVFGDMLRIGPRLREWAEAEVVRDGAQVELRMARSAELPELPELAPLLAVAFGNRPFQSVGAKFILDGARGGKGVCVADEPGLGKTLETLAALALARSRRVLVFCRKTAMYSVWARETNRWLPHLAVLTVAEGDRWLRKERIKTYFKNETVDPFTETMHVLVCNIEMMRVRRDEVDGKEYNMPEYEGLFSHEWDAIVIDESHNALIGKSVLSKGCTQTRRGAVLLPLAPDGMKICLSGTPFRGKEKNMWGTLNWLRPDLYKSSWRWWGYFFGVEENDYGGAVVGDSIIPEKKVEFDRSIAGLLLRRTKAEVAADLPAKMYPGTPLHSGVRNSPVGIWLEMTPAQKRIYDSIVQDGVAEIEGGILMANGALAELTRLKQIATCAGIMDGPGVYQPVLPSNKLEWISDFADVHKGNEGKIIIASQFTKVVNLFSDALMTRGFANYVITGETPLRRRTEVVKRFANPGDPVRICLINTKAGGESITLDEADNVIIVDETHIPDEQIQVEDRAHRVSRAGGRVPVSVYYLRSLGTVEEDIAVICQAREGACKERLDGSRGIEIIKNHPRDLVARAASLE